MAEAAVGGRGGMVEEAPPAVSDTVEAAREDEGREGGGVPAAEAEAGQGVGGVVGAGVGGAGGVGEGEMRDRI